VDVPDLRRRYSRVIIGRIPLERAIISAVVAGTPVAPVSATAPAAANRMENASFPGIQAVTRRLVHLMDGQIYVPYFPYQLPPKSAKLNVDCGTRVGVCEIRKRWMRSIL
jgi:hypothetical protein